MFDKLKPKSEFSKNVLTLMTGTTIAQAIRIGISPILTRIYTPEDFGVFALYLSIASILSVIATGRYELAIILPKKSEDAINIVALSIMISFFVSLFLFLVVYAFNTQITHLLGNPKISNWLYFIPLTVLLTGIYQSFNYWLNRKKQYTRLATSRVIQSGTTASANLGLGFSDIRSSGLILGQILGQSIATSVLMKMFFREDKNKIVQIKKLKILALAKKYIKFPKFLMLAHSVNTVSSQSAIILLSILFSTVLSGYYMLIQRVFALPISILASSISDVFRQKAAFEYLKDSNCMLLYRLTLKKLVLISLLPFLVFYFIAPDLFSFVFGKDWEIAGKYAQILTPMFFLQFISSPLGNMFMIAQKQELDLYWQISLFILIFLAFYIGKYVFNDIEITMKLFCISYSIGYIANLVMTYKFARGTL